MPTSHDTDQPGCKAHQELSGGKRLQSQQKRTAGEVQLRQEARREGAPQLRLGQLHGELLPLLQHALQACVAHPVVDTAE